MPYSLNQVSPPGNHAGPRQAGQADNQQGAPRKIASLVQLPGRWDPALALLLVALLLTRAVPRRAHGRWWRPAARWLRGRRPFAAPRRARYSPVQHDP